MSAERGVALVELLVALALLGIVLGVAAVRLLPERMPETDRVGALLKRARHRAIREGRAITVTLQLDSLQPALATAFPDGRVAGPLGFAIDPISGYWHAPR